MGGYRGRGRRDDPVCSNCSRHAPPDAPQGPFKLGAGRVTSLQIYRVTSC